MEEIDEEIRKLKDEIRNDNEILIQSIKDLEKFKLTFLLFSNPA